MQAFLEGTFRNLTDWGEDIETNHSKNKHTFYQQFAAGQ